MVNPLQRLSDYRHDRQEVRRALGPENQNFW